MFLTHQSEIQQFAAQSADNTLKVLKFVQFTIQQNFAGMPKMIEEYNKTGTVKRITKRQKYAIKVYTARKQEIFDTIFSGISIDDKLLFVASLPGFGLAKAGFVLQCTIGRVGCLDVHNLKRFSLKASAFTLTKTYNSNLKKAQKYIDICDKILGCAYLWNSWCELIAEKYPQYYADCEHVSRLHVDCIKNLA